MDLVDESEVGKFTQEKLMDQGMESKVTIMVAITTFLTNAPEMGNSQLKEALLGDDAGHGQEGRVHHPGAGCQ